MMTDLATWSCSALDDEAESVVRFSLRGAVWAWRRFGKDVLARRLTS